MWALLRPGTVVWAACNVWFSSERRDLLCGKERQCIRIAVRVGGSLRYDTVQELRFVK